MCPDYEPWLDAQDASTPDDHDPGFVEPEVIDRCHDCDAPTPEADQYHVWHGSQHVRLCGCCYALGVAE
jgi:hypothetical protein